jgi:hypothetical protein
MEEWYVVSARWLVQLEVERRTERTLFCKSAETLVGRYYYLSRTGRVAITKDVFDNLADAVAKFNELQDWKIDLAIREIAEVKKKAELELALRPRLVFKGGRWGFVTYDGIEVYPRVGATAIESVEDIRFYWWDVQDNDVLEDVVARPGVKEYICRLRERRLGGKT